MGYVVTSPSLTCTNDSGEEPMIWNAVSEKSSFGTFSRNMYGLGLETRSMR